MARIWQWFTWSRFLAAALLLHVLIAAGLFVAERGAAPQPAPAPTPAEPMQLIVELVSAAELMPEAGTATLPPEPAVAEAAPEPSSPEDEATGEGVFAAPAPHEGLGEGVLHAIAVEAEYRPAPRAVADDEAAVLPVSGYAVGDIPDDIAHVWEQHLLAHLDNHKQYPRLAERRGQEDVVFVHVRVDRAGQVLQHRVVGSRGYRLLEAEALALMTRASPLPPPPSELPDKLLQFRVPVAFFIERQ